MPKIQTSCPNCQQPIIAEIQQVIDVGRNPQAKDLILSGELNMALCQVCGFQGQLPVPVVYHDAEKELRPEGDLDVERYFRIDFDRFKNRLQVFHPLRNLVVQFPESDIGGWIEMPDVGRFRHLADYPGQPAADIFRTQNFSKMAG